MSDRHWKASRTALSAEPPGCCACGLDATEAVQSDRSRPLRIRHSEAFPSLACAARTRIAHRVPSTVTFTGLSPSAHQIADVLKRLRRPGCQPLKVGPLVRTRRRFWSTRRSASGWDCAVPAGVPGIAAIGATRAQGSASFHRSLVVSRQDGLQHRRLPRVEIHLPGRHRVGAAVVVGAKDIQHAPRRRFPAGRSPGSSRASPSRHVPQFRHRPERTVEDDGAAIYLTAEDGIAKGAGVRGRDRRVCRSHRQSDLAAALHVSTRSAANHPRPGPRNRTMPIRWKHSRYFRRAGRG